MIEIKLTKLSAIIRVQAGTSFNIQEMATRLAFSFFSALKESDHKYPDDVLLLKIMDGFSAGLARAIDGNCSGDCANCSVHHRAATTKEGVGI